MTSSRTWRLRALPLALTLALLAGVCEETATQLEGNDEETGPGMDWTPTPLRVRAEAVGGTTGVDTAYTRVPLEARLMVANDNGSEAGTLRVTLHYVFAEISDSVEHLAPGVYRLGDPEIRHPTAEGVVEVTLAPLDSAELVVPLGVPRPLTEMSASRHIVIDSVRVLEVRPLAADPLDAAPRIRTGSNLRFTERRRQFGHLGSVYTGIVLPALVPGEVTLDGAATTGIDTLPPEGERVWHFAPGAGTAARLSFDVFNQSRDTVPAGASWAVMYDAGQTVVVGADTVRPQETLASGALATALAPGATTRIEGAFEGVFPSPPVDAPEFVVLVDTRSIARDYPVLLAGRPIRAWFTVEPTGTAVPSRAPAR